MNDQPEDQWTYHAVADAILAHSLLRAQPEVETTFAKGVSANEPEKAANWMSWWDPSNHLPKARMPMLWVTGSNDFAYWLPALQKSYRLIPSAHRTVAIRLRMPHGHGPAGEAPKEIAVFADSILKDGKPLASVTSQERTGNQVSVGFQSAHPIVKAELNFTSDNTIPWPKREWKAIPAIVQDGKAIAEVPGDARFYYMNLFDDRDCVVSSEHVETAIP